MAAIKKFFQKRKLDVKFKRAGDGHKLAEEGPPRVRPQPSSSGVSPAHHVPQQHKAPHETSAAARTAAEAALARHQGQRKPGALDPTHAAKARMKREIEAERKKEQEALALSQRYTEPQEIVKDTGHNTVILFKCPDIGPVVLPKDEMVAYIHEFLLTQLADEPEMTSALMIHTLNTDKDRVKICIDTLCKYLDNIINNPLEEKYRKIRLSNKAFKERVSDLNGTEEFLQAAGFEIKLLPFEDREEHFYIMDEKMAADADRLTNIKDVLKTAEPIRPQLDRALKVFYKSSAGSNFSVPDEFYSVSPEELKKEQKRKQEAVETLGMLRTKAMRERDERREILKYRYTFLRVRFPDGIMIQGTFKATEKFSALMDFVRENLMNEWMPFKIRSPTGGRLENEEDKMLAELGLTPAALLAFEWDPTVMAEVTAQQGSSQQTFLKQEVMALIQDFR